MSVYPVVLCTRGRAGASPTMQALGAAGVPMTLVVEPQEREAYATAAPAATLWTLPAADRGLAYARNYALTTARRQGLGWYWMLDDDLTGWFVVRAQRAHPVSVAEALATAQGWFPVCEDLVMVSLQLKQYAWCAPQPVRLWAHQDNAICLHAQRLRGLRYDERLPLKVDRDFALQALAAGWLVVRMDHVAMTEPRIGTNPGGLHAVYASGAEATAVARMLAKWGPEVCVPVRKARGWDLVIRWRQFRAGRATPAG